MKKAIIYIIIQLYVCSVFGQEIYNCGAIQSREKVLYGSFTMRIKMPEGSSVSSGFSTSYNPDNLPSTYNWTNINFKVRGTSENHMISTGFSIRNDHSPVSTYPEHYNSDYSLSDDYHIYSLVWTPDSIVWYLDNSKIKKETDPAILGYFRKAQNFGFDSRVSCGAFLDQEVFPTQTNIDWIIFCSFKDGRYKLEWIDDFTDFDTTRWEKISGQPDCNQANYSESNANIENGLLKLSITDPLEKTTTGENVKHSLDKALIRNIKMVEEVQLELVASEYYNVRVINMEGKQVFNDEFYGTSFTFPYAGFAKGLYLILIQSKGNMVTKKIYIQ